MNKNLNFRLSGYINSFLASSFLILLFKRELSDFDYSLWGIITSLTLIFSIITQFTMPNMIEKDFMELERDKKINLILTYFKYLIFFSPLIYLCIYAIYNFNQYFYSYKFLIPFFILLLIIVENSINLLNKILITKKESATFDKVELFFVKYLRLFVFTFYFFLISKISFLNILILHITTRLISLLLLLFLKNDFLKDLRLYKFRKLSVGLFKNNINSNLNNFYINLGQFFFYNFVYLTSSYFFTIENFANLSLYFIIFIFCRNFFDAFANLKTPEIKKDSNYSKLKLFEKDYYLYSVPIVLIFHLVIEFIFKFDLYSIFSNFISEDSSQFISAAIFHGFITGIYSFRHYVFKFDKKFYKTHLNFYLINIVFNGSVYFLLVKYLNPILALTTTLLLYEFLNILFYYRFFIRVSNRNQIYSFSFGALLLFFSVLINNFFFYLFVFFISLFQLIKSKIYH